jgi:hypothetical protein
MARVYQRSQDPFTGGVQAPRLPALSAGAVGAEALANALGQAARAGDVLGAAELRKLDLEGAAYDNKALARLEADARAELRRLEDEAQPGGADHAKRFATWYGERRRSILEAAPKGYDQQRLVASMDGLAVDLGDRADRFERAARVEFQVSSHGEALADRRRMVQADPSLHGRMVEQTRASFAALDVPPIVAAKLEREALAELAGDRIEGLILRDPSAALAELDQGGAPDVDPDRRLVLLHRARAAVETREREAAAAAETAAKRAGEQVAETLFSLGVDGPAGGEAMPGTGRRASLGAMLGAVNDLPDPVARDAARGRVLELYAADEKARDDRRRMITEAAFGLLEEGGRVTDIDAASWAELEPSTRTALEARQRQIAAGVEPVTDWGTYLGLEAMPDAELAAFDLRTVRPYLANEHFERVAARQGKILQGEATDDPASLQQQIAAAADRLGLDGEARGLLTDRAYRAVDAEQRRTGKTLDYASRAAILDRLTVEGTTGEGWVFDARARAFEAALADMPTFTRADLDEQAVEIAGAVGVPALALPGLADKLEAIEVAVTVETLAILHALETAGMEPTLANMLEVHGRMTGQKMTRRAPPGQQEATLPRATPPAPGRTIGEALAAEVAP